MDKSELAKAIAELNAVIASSKKPPTSSYAAPKDVKNDVKNFSKQKSEHREKLLRLVTWLSILSFLFLVAIISFQMWKRTSFSEYTGVSDTVINIITGGVF